jgi:hypothetical protein
VSKKRFESLGVMIHGDKVYGYRLLSPRGPLLGPLAGAHVTVRYDAAMPRTVYTKALDGTVTRRDEMLERWHPPLPSVMARPGTALWRPRRSTQKRGHSVPPGSSTRLPAPLAAR